jgi:hypothetical protein
MTTPTSEDCTFEDDQWWPRALARHHEALKDVGPEFEDYVPELLAIAETEGRDFPRARRALAADGARPAD